MKDNTIHELEKVVGKNFERNEGPFVKALDRALSTFNVSRQAYYSGTFVGNHVHRCLQVYINSHSIVPIDND